MSELKRAKEGCFTCRIRRKGCTRSNKKRGEPCDDCSRLCIECLESTEESRPNWLREKDYRRRAALDAIATWNSYPRNKKGGNVLPLKRFALPDQTIEQKSNVENWSPEYDQASSFPSSTAPPLYEPDTYRRGAQPSISSQVLGGSVFVPLGLLPLRYLHQPDDIAYSGRNLYCDDDVADPYAEKRSSSAAPSSFPLASNGQSYEYAGYNANEPRNTFDYRNSYDPGNKYEPHTTYEHRSTREPHSTPRTSPVGPLFYSSPMHQEGVHNWGHVPSMHYPHPAV